MNRSIQLITKAVQTAIGLKIDNPIYSQCPYVATGVDLSNAKKLLENPRITSSKSFPRKESYENSIFLNQQKNFINFGSFVQDTRNKRIGSDFDSTWDVYWKKKFKFYDCIRFFYQTRKFNVRIISQYGNILPEKNSVTFYTAPDIIDNIDKLILWRAMYGGIACSFYNSSQYTSQNAYLSSITPLSSFENSLYNIGTYPVDQYLASNTTANQFDAFHFAFSLFPGGLVGPGGLGGFSNEFLVYDEEFVLYWTKRLKRDQLFLIGNSRPDSDDYLNYIRHSANSATLYVGAIARGALSSDSDCNIYPAVSFKLFGENVLSTGLRLVNGYFSEYNAKPYGTFLGYGPFDTVKAGNVNFFDKDDNMYASLDFYVADYNCTAAYTYGNSPTPISELWYQNATIEIREFEYYPDSFFWI